MKRIGILVNTGKPEAQALLPRLAEAARAQGVHLVSFQPDVSKTIPPVEQTSREAFPAAIDALLTLGGDGTLLQVVSMLEHAAFPVLGVNLGRLGFLTGATADQLEDAFAALVSGNIVISRRTMLEGRILTPDGQERGRVRALNDLVVGWGQSTRIVTLDVAINDEPVTSYRCDGIIVSTPTGSTGHSLSAGGPIVHPDSASLVLNVVCPHTLSARPLVIPDDARILIGVKQTGKKLLLSADGRDADSLCDGDALAIQKAPQTFHLARLPGGSYYGVLREKLQWSGSSA